MDLSAKSINRQIVKNKAEFDRLFARALKCQNVDERIDRLWEACAQAAWKTCGFYTSSALEAALCQVGVTLPGGVANEFTKNSFLHVLTEAYPGGGHTQVVTRWIENSPKGQTHSLLLSGQKNKNEIPPRLREVVAARGGKFTVLNVRDKAVLRADALRAEASRYEAVILHVHCDDPLPILAFCAPRFTRPVILFNHADHLFWVGGSVADLVVNLRSSSSSFNEKYRLINRNQVLPLPVYEPRRESSAQNAAAVRQKLGIAAEGKIIFSIARGYKYTPFDDMDFAKTVRQILARVPNSFLVVIGPSAAEPYWQKAMAVCPGRIKVLGSMPFGEVEPYLQSADLVLDSFPFNSFTALFDAAKYNVPTLSLRTPIGETDAYTVSGISCQTQEELIEKAVWLLQHRPTGDTAIYHYLKEHQFPLGFQRHLADLYAHFPTTHQVWPLEKEPSREIIELERFVEKNNRALSVSAKEKRKKLRRWLFTFQWGHRTKKICLLGVSFYSRQFH